MKSLADNYKATHGNSHETFADLIFCALVVLVLFVLALAVEVSQRVRAEEAAVRDTEEVKAEEAASMTPEEIEKLSTKMRQQSEEIMQLQSRLTKSKERVDRQLSALAGEQCFTGAREPAAINIAYNYFTGRFHLIPSKLIEHADRRQSGETMIEYAKRKSEELVDIALKARKSRDYSEEEIIAIYSSMTQYNEVVQQAGGYRIRQQQVGIHYHTLLCRYIAGEADSQIDRESEVVAAILKVHSSVGQKHDGMYPKMTLTIDEGQRMATVGGVALNHTDLRVLLISISGRGLVLDFEGYNGKAPQWLYDKVLMPSGYISKTPKLPRI